MNSLNGMELDDEIEWLDELDWTPIQQTISRSASGALDIQEQLLTKGRPMTLKLRGAYADVNQLMDLLSEADPLSLELNGQTYAVKWRHAERPIQAEPDYPVVNPVDFPELRYTLTLRLIEV